MVHNFIPARKEVCAAILNVHGLDGAAAGGEKDFGHLHTSRTQGNGIQGEHLLPEFRVDGHEGDSTVSFCVHVGDSLAVLRTLPSESVQCVVTSPPYWGLRDYGVDGQIGLEATPAEFIAKIVAVFSEVRRVLRSDGTCWVNMGDSYATGTTSDRNASATGKHGYWENPAVNKRVDGRSVGLKPKDLIGMPWRLAFALQADGWWLRQDIIWAKPNPMPESVTDRCTKAHEYLFLLTKCARYFYDSEAIRERATADHPAGNTSHKGLTAYEGGDERHRTKQGLVAYASRNGKKAFRGQGSNRNTPNGPANRDGRDLSDAGVGATRNKRSVWEIATEPYSEAHFATFPTKLVEPCIMAGSRPGDIVLDPFSGAGTTGLVAQRLGRNYVGIELNSTYAQMSRDRIHGDQPLFSEQVPA